MTPADSTFGAGSGSTVTVRMAAEGDAGTLARLAALDSARIPDMPLLVAESDARIIAALPLGSGRPVADPFTRTTELVELLQLREAQLRAAEQASARTPRRLFRRLLPA